MGGARSINGGIAPLDDQHTSNDDACTCNIPQNHDQQTLTHNERRCNETGEDNDIKPWSARVKHTVS